MTEKRSLPRLFTPAALLTMLAVLVGSVGPAFAEDIRTRLIECLFSSDRAGSLKKFAEEEFEPRWMYTPMSVSGLAGSNQPPLMKFHVVHAGYQGESSVPIG